MSKIKLLKGKTKDWRWIDVNDDDFTVEQFVEVEIIEIMTKDEFKEIFANY